MQHTRTMSKHVTIFLHFYSSFLSKIVLPYIYFAFCCYCCWLKVFYLACKGVFDIVSIPVFLYPLMARGEWLYPIYFPFTAQFSKMHSSVNDFLAWIVFMWRTVSFLFFLLSWMLSISNV